MDKRNKERVSATPGAWEAALRERLQGVELPGETTPPVVIPGTLSTRRRRRRLGWVAGMVASVAVILLIVLLSPRQEQLPTPLPVDDPVAVLPSEQLPSVEETPETTPVERGRVDGRRAPVQRGSHLLSPIRSGTALLVADGRRITPDRPSRFVPKGGADEAPPIQAIDPSDFSLPETPSRTSSSCLLASAVIPGGGVSGGGQSEMFTSTAPGYRERKIQLSRRPVLELEAHLMKPIWSDRLYADMGFFFSWQRVGLADGEEQVGYFTQDMRSIGVSPGLTARLLRLGPTEVSGYGAVGLALPLGSETASDLPLPEGDREKRAIVDLRTGLRLSASVSGGLRAYASAGLVYDLVPPMVALPHAELPRVAPQISVGLSMDLPDLAR